jgi:hypothetical protein
LWLAEDLLRLFPLEAHQVVAHIPRIWHDAGDTEAKVRAAADVQHRLLIDTVGLLALTRPQLRGYLESMESNSMMHRNYWHCW